MLKKLLLTFLGLISIFSTSSTYSQVLPLTTNKLNSNANVKILFVGDSVTGGFGLIQPPSFVDSPSSPSPRSYVAEFAYQLAQRYSDSNVLLIYRSMQTNSDGSANCTPGEQQRYIQQVAYPKRTITVIRDGVGGNNIYRYLARISGIYDGSQPRFPSTDQVHGGSAAYADTVFLMFGINDSLTGPALSTCYPSSFYLGWNIGSKNLQTRGELPSEFETGLGTAVNWTRGQQPYAEIALITPSWSYDYSTLGAYATKVRSVAQAKNTGLIEIYGIFNDHQKSNTFCNQNGWFTIDCFHPNEVGHRVIGRSVFNDAFGFQNGWWFNPYESGRGFFLDRVGGKAYFIAHGYDVDGRATWYASDVVNVDYSDPTGNNFSTVPYSILRTFYGGQTLTGAWRPAYQSPSPGSMTLTLNNTNNGYLTWPQSYTYLTKFDFVANGNRSPIVDIYRAPQSGVWWNPYEGGRGWEIEVQGGLIYINGHMYDNLGKPIWYAASAGRTASGVYDGTWVEYAGGQTLGGPYKSPYLKNANVGSLKLTFSDRKNGSLRLPDGRVIPIQRFSLR